jgi:Zn-finger nucleic acid-binding protein
MTDIAAAAILMPCPKCATPMRTIERSGIHLETCPDCRGMFLDRGELDRLLDLETATSMRGARSRRHDDASEQWRDRDDDDDDADDHGGPWGRGADEGDRRPGRRGGFLSELFENLGG